MAPASNSDRPVMIPLIDAVLIPSLVMLEPADRPIGLGTDPERRAKVKELRAAMVGALRDAALAAGATRLSLTTEPDNQAALGLYRGLGFKPVEGLVSLSLNIADQQKSRKIDSAA